MDAMIVGHSQKRDRWSFGHAEEIDFLRELFTRSRAKTLDSLGKLALVELDEVVHRVEPCGPVVLDFRVVNECRVANTIHEPQIRSGEVRRQFPRRPRFFIRLVVAAVVGNRAQHLQSVRGFLVEHCGKVIGDGFRVIRCHGENFSSKQAPANIYDFGFYPPLASQGRRICIDAVRCNVLCIDKYLLHYHRHDDIRPGISSAGIGGGCDGYRRWCGGYLRKAAGGGEGPPESRALRRGIYWNCLCRYSTLQANGASRGRGGMQRRLVYRRARREADTEEHEDRL